MCVDFHLLTKLGNECIYALQRVHCSHGHVVDRQTFQDRLSLANPEWKAYMDGLEATGQRPRTNPDGDVCDYTRTNTCALALIIAQVALEGVQYDSFKVPECPDCLVENKRNSIVR